MLPSPRFFVVRGPKADAALMMQLGSDGGRQYIPPYHADSIDSP